MILKQSVSLMGFMGCGKSTIGELLANNLQVPFYDLDNAIEEHAGMSINEIFEKYGEYYFRKIERMMLQRILKQTPGVISLGGGSPCFYNNIAEINRHSTSFYLKLKVDLLAERLLSDSENRPLIKTKNKTEIVQFINDKLTERSKYYSLANHTLISQNIDEIIQEIKRALF